jgi:putative transposase
MKTLQTCSRQILECLRFGCQVVAYALIFFSAFFRIRASLGCEMVALRSQLTFYKESIRQKKQPRPRFTPAFRLLGVLLSTVWSGWKSAANLMKPKTVLKWHGGAFRQWWRWKSLRKGGRPAISPDMPALIRRLSRENALWSAETIHGHLALLGFDPPCPDTIRKYMVRPKAGPEKSQHWLTFLRNHMPVSWGMDFFTVPTLRFQVLFVFVVLNHSRRQVVHFRVTAHPTLAWVIQQLREAMPFGQQPTYLFRDNNGIYGDEVGQFLVGTGIEEIKTAYRSPWQTRS